MAEQKQDKKQEKSDKPKQGQDKPSKDSKEVKKGRPEPQLTEALVRIFGYDLPASKAAYVAFTRIKGVSWSISNAVCLQLGLPHNKKIGELTKDDIAKIENVFHTINVPDYMKNRRLDPETGQTSHLYGTDLDIAKDFDIKRMKKMKSYKGIRHTSKLPVRGQRTRSHFRAKKGTGAGIARKKVAAAPAAGAAK